ncbi:MAG: 16S rRNA (cytidine(1402)-2'-O)-methyltransferase [Candidatus Bipolaricaulia bacterium]
MSGKLFICATPIGNLDDITLRALRVFREADLIVAEDTRRSRQLLQRYEITTPFGSSYYQGVEQRRVGPLVSRLEQGEQIALISDAGTPLISDPGYRLVHRAIAAGIPVVPIPGPTALIAALVISGLPTDRFVFDGMPPRRLGRRRRYFEEIRAEPRTIILYESPHRILTTLELMDELLGDRNIALCRELTKRFEEVIRGTPGQVLDQLQNRGQSRVKGELTLVIQGAGKRNRE